VTLRTATGADVPALLLAANEEVVAANGWPDEPGWVEAHLRALVGRKHTVHDYVEHLAVAVAGELAGVRSMYKRGDRLVTHGWMRARGWRDHDTELDLVTRFAHFHLGFPLVFAVAARNDDSDRALLEEHGYTGPHRAERSVQLANGTPGEFDVFVHREQAARHTCSTLEGPGAVRAGPATVRTAGGPPTYAGEGAGMGFRVVVDFDRCESNALCMGVAPEVFEVRDDDFLYVLQEQPPESLREKCQEAARLCPKQAIAIVDE
jgi:ferredoxin